MGSKRWMVADKPVARSKKTLKDTQLCNLELKEGTAMSKWSTVQIDMKKNFLHVDRLRA